MEQVHQTHHRIFHTRTDILIGSLFTLDTANHKSKHMLMSNGLMEKIHLNSRMQTTIWHKNYLHMLEKMHTSQDGVEESLMLHLSQEMEHSRKEQTTLILKMCLDLRKEQHNYFQK